MSSDILLKFLLTVFFVVNSSSTTNVDSNDKNSFDHDAPSLMPPSFNPSMMDHSGPPFLSGMPGLQPIMPPFMPGMMSGIMSGMVPPMFAGMFGGVSPGMMMPHLSHSMSHSLRSSMTRHPHTHGGMGFAHPYPSAHHGMYDPLMDPGMLGSGNSFPGIPLKDSPKCRVTCDRVCDAMTGCTSNCMRQCCTFEKISTPLQSDLPQHPSGVNIPPTFDNIHPQFDPHHVPLHGLHGPHLHGGFHGFPVKRTQEETC